MGYTDIHSHILPQVDDGAATVEESLRLLKLAREQGITTVIFTPHCKAKYDEEREKKKADKIKKKFIKLKELAAQTPLIDEMQLYLGNELYYGTQIHRLLQMGHANTLAGSKYVLVEFATDISFLELKKAVQELFSFGYYPVIAHIERYRCLFAQYTNLKELKSMGCYLQVNTQNFLEGFFSKNKKFVLTAMQLGYIDFLATDCHNERYRKPIMKEIVPYLEKKVDKAILNRIFYENPQRLLGIGERYESEQ